MSLLIYKTFIFLKLHYLKDYIKEFNLHLPYISYQK